jgi:hypothetical protein
MKHDLKRTGKLVGLAALCLVAFLLAWTVPFLSGKSLAQTYNQTALLNTTVNITNAAPLVTAINLQTPINLVGFGNSSVTCNVSVTDFDNDTLTVDATLYHRSEAGGGSPDDGNNHYTNASCERLSAQDINTTWTCGFDLRFYANNASNWECNVTVDDGVSLVPVSNLSNLARVEPLIAIVIPGVLDFGELITGQISTDRFANITNGGNRNINISVEGFGNTLGDGIAMDCTYGVIPFTEMRYSRVNGTTFASMTQISNDTTMINNYFIDRRFSEINDINSTNSTAWKLRIPLAAAGICNGKILFTGSDSQG